MANEINNLVRQNSSLVSNNTVSALAPDASVVEERVRSQQARQDAVEQAAEVAAKQQAEEEQNQQQLNNAVEKLSSYVQNLKRELNFSMNEDLGSVVIKVIDAETDELIRSIPSEEVIERAEFLNSSLGNLLQAKV